MNGNMALWRVGLWWRGLVVGMVLALLLAHVGPADAAASPRQAGITGSNATAAERGGEADDGSPASPAGLRPMTTSEMQGYGCLVSGAAATLLTVIAGTNELVMVFAGSPVLPTTSIGLGLAVGGTIFASVCAVGALATPAVVRLWNYYYDGMRVAPAP